MFAMLLALLAAVLWGASDFIAGVTTRGMPVTKVLAISQPLGLGVCLVALAISGQSLPSGGRLVAALLVGPAAVIELGLLYVALATGPAMIVAPIAALGAGVPVVVGVVGRGDPVTAMTGVATVACLLGVAGASWSPNEAADATPVPGHVSTARSVLLALGTALFAGIAVTLMNVAALDGDPIGATTALQGSTAVIAVAVYGALVWRRRHAGRGIEAGTAGAIVSAGPSTAMPAAVVASAPRRARNSATTLFALLAIGGGSVAADAVFAAASTHGALAVIAVLAGLYPVFTVLASLVFLRQRTTVIQTASAVAALAGITLFALA